MISKQQNDSDMESLQPAYLRVIRFIGLFVCVIISTALSFVFWVLFSMAWYFTALVWVSLFISLSLVLSGYLRHWYKNYSYQLDDVRLAIKRGVFWRHHISVPISRVQHVDVNSGPLDRRYDLAKLVVNTAGTHHAQTSLPGLSLAQAHELRDQLLAVQQGDTV